MSTALIAQPDRALLDPSTLGVATDLAQRIAATEFVPASLRNRPEAVVAAILKGLEIGVGPMQALSMIDVIEGRPAIRAELMRALVMRAGHRIWVEESTNSRATVCGSRVDEQRTDKVSWTLDDAQLAGLKGRQNWQRYPRQMLVARATAELCRRQFADVLGGIPAIEEVADGEGGGTIVDVSPAPATPATRRRLRRGEAVPAPVETTVGQIERVESERQKAENATGERPSVEPQAGTSEASGDADGTAETLGAQREHIAMQCRDQGVDRRQVIAAVTGGRKESARALTADEEHGVLDALRRMKLGEVRLDVTGAEARLVDAPASGDADPLTDLQAQGDEDGGHRALYYDAAAEGLRGLQRETLRAVVIGFGWTSGETLSHLLDRLSTDELERLCERIEAESRGASPA